MATGLPGAILIVQISNTTRSCGTDAFGNSEGSTRGLVQLAHPHVKAHVNAPKGRIAIIRRVRSIIFLRSGKGRERGGARVGGVLGGVNGT